MNADTQDKLTTVLVGIGGTILLALVTGLFIGITWKVAAWIIN